MKLFCRIYTIAIFIFINITFVKGQTFNPTYSINTGGSADALMGGYTFAYATSGSPWNGAFMSFGGFANTYDCQMSSDYGTGKHLSFRTRNGDTHTWNPWYETWHSGNLNRSDADFLARAINCTNIYNSGNLGIGTTSPLVPLHIIKSSAATTDVPMQRWDPSVAGYNLTLSNYNGVHGIDFRLTQTQNGTAFPVMTFQGGNVGINTTEPQGYRFAVNGSAIATSMTVKLNNNWPDYVFKPDYHLPALKEVKTYIDQNGRLPEMPSEHEVMQNGVNLGEMNKLLTKKVEELTLYLINQQQQINELKNQIIVLNNPSKSEH